MTFQWTDTLNARVGEEIRHLRISLGLSQTELGTKVGLTQHQIQRYETAQSPITVDRLARIAVVLKVDPGHFFGRAQRLSASKLETAPDLTIGLLGKEDLELAAKIALIRDDAARRDLIASIDRLAEALARRSEINDGKAKGNDGSGTDASE